MNGLTGLAHQMRECAGIAEAFVHTLNFGANPPPFPPLGANGQFPMTMVPMQVAHDEQGKKRKGRGEDAEGKRKVKKPRDPNAPKRPASSYLLFQNDVRNELKAKNPGMRNNELLNAIAKMWAEMPQEQKDAYEARNRAAKDHWLAQKAIYEQTGKTGEASGLPMQVAAVPAPVPIKAAPAPAAAAAATPSSSEESTNEDDDSSSDSSSEEEEAAPPPKKSKRESVATPAKEEVAPKKEKKHKKSKA
ncbi:HMG-box [Trametes cingulata]|nr:HMG-box [Trametes cingulata]